MLSLTLQEIRDNVCLGTAVLITSREHFLPETRSKFWAVKYSTVFMFSKKTASFIVA